MLEKHIIFNKISQKCLLIFLSLKPENTLYSFVNSILKRKGILMYESITLIRNTGLLSDGEDYRPQYFSLFQCL